MNHIISEIGKNFFLLRSTEKDLHRNIYLKKFSANGKHISNMVFDPGTKLDMADLLTLFREKIGGIKNLKMIFLSHQDPDVASNTPLLISSTKKAKVVTSVDTWRLVEMYGIPHNRAVTIESFDSNKVIVKNSGQKLKFIPIPFCHFKGATMVYDIESRVLFTSDLLSGVNTQKDNNLYATEDAWDGIKLFQQLYMPTNIALRHAVDTINLLNPFPKVIAPQHGNLITGDLIHEFLKRLRTLEVGMDIVLTKEEDKEAVILGLNNFISFVETDSKELYTKLIKIFQKGHHFTSPFMIDHGKIVDLKVTADIAIKTMRKYIDDESGEEKSTYYKAIFEDNLEQVGITSESDNAEVNDEGEFEDVGELEDTNWLEMWSEEGQDYADS
jgi:glyoxylase-like metal-dependent hydrolase (beta-lactamase superfamily II)